MTAITTVQSVPTPSPLATIDTRNQSRRAQAEGYAGGPDDLDTPMDDDADDGDPALPASMTKLVAIATQGGDISNLLNAGQVEKLGADALRHWEIDKGTRETWLETAKRSLDIAAQENDEDGPKDFPFDSASDIHYPLLTTSSQQFAARALPALIKGDKVVGVRVFTPPINHPPTLEAAKAGPQPQDPQQAQQASQAISGQEQKDAQHDLMLQARQMRGERVKAYLNWTIFYKMDNWQGETDQLLHEVPVTGAGFKKVYMGTTGLCSDYVSALRLTVHNDTKSLARCPRLTQEFDCYPYEIEERQRAGIYRDVEIPNITDDPQKPREFIEQHTLADLDGDGFSEPYILTIDVDSRHVLRVEPSFTAEDIVIDDTPGSERVIRIDRWRAFSEFIFLPDPRGRFYGIGFGKLLESIMDSIDTSMNQLIDAGTAEIAGGGFIAGGVRIQGGGQGGAVYWQPGQYQMVSAQGNDLKAAIWERTVPHPSAVTMQLLEILLAAAKDITAVKDVITGNTPATAPVGTTLALQDQALQVFSAIYKRMYRGFADEFRLMYLCLKRWATDRERKEYLEVTGGDFDEDFTGDGTDIQPVADPAVVTRMQQVARLQTLIQLAESPIGQAAGMNQPGPAQAIVMEGLEALNWDRPERFVGPIPPNPEMVAKTQDMQASAQLKSAQAQGEAAQVTLDHAKAVHQIGLAARDTHGLHALAQDVQVSGVIKPPEVVANPPPPVPPAQQPPGVLTSPALT